MKITLGNTLPPYPDFVEGIRRTHDRGYTLVPVQAKLSPAVTSTTCRLPFPMIFYKVMDNLELILAIELMNAAQGVDFRRPLKTSPLLEHFLHTCRKEVPFVKDDIVNPLAELNKRIFKSANRFVVNVVYILKDCKCTYFP